MIECRKCNWLCTGGLQALQAVSDSAAVMSDTAERFADLQHTITLQDNYTRLCSTLQHSLQAVVELVLR